MDFENRARTVKKVNLISLIIIIAMGVPFTAAHGSIRFSLSKYNTEEEVDYTIEKIPQIVNHLRKLSPFVAK